VHIHFPHIHYALNRELTELYASIALRQFALGLIVIFEPIYIFLYFSHDISKALLFFGAISLFQGLLSPFSGKIITKIGVKHSMLLSVPFLFSYYFGLWKIEALGGLFFILIIFKILHNLLYWPAFHIDFARFSEKKNRGKQLSYRHIIAALSAAASPFIGGVIIANTNAGYPTLFLIVLTLLFISVFPLFLSKEIHERYTDSFHKAFGEVFQKKYRYKAISFFAQGSEAISHIFIWPIFLFTLTISYSSIGLISSAALFGGVIFSLFLGRLIDKVGRERLLSVGAWLNAFTWPIKMFVHTPIDAFFINTLHQFTRLTAYMPFLTIFYDWSSRDDVNRDRLVILREMTLNTGRGIVLFSFAGLFLFIDNLAVAFPIAAVFSLLMIFFIKGQPSSEGTSASQGRKNDT